MINTFLIFLFPILTYIKSSSFIAVGSKASDTKKEEQLFPVKPFEASFYLGTQLYKLHIIKTNQSKGNKKVLQND